MNRYRHPMWSTRLCLNTILKHARTGRNHSTGRSPSLSPTPRSGALVSPARSMSRHTPRSMFRESSHTFSEESLDVPPDVFIEEEDENGVKFLRRVTAGGKCYCLLLLLSNATCSWLVRKFLGEVFAVKRLQRAYAESKEVKVQVCVLARQSSFRM